MFKTLKHTLPVMVFLLLAGCFNDEEKSNNQTAELSCRNELATTGTFSGYAVIAAAQSPDWSTTDMLILVSEEDGDFELRQGEFSTTNPNDIVVSASGSSLYRLNRSLDSITAYSATSSGQVNFSWEYSVLGTNNSANPYAVAVDAYNCGFVARYDSDSLWIVNLDAGSQGKFKGAEFDLSAYAPGSDATPNMSGLTIAGDYLIVLMERLTGWSPEDNSFLAIIDLNNLEEVDTETTEGLLGIDLGVRNAANMSVQGDHLFVAARGDTGFGGVGQYEGGIVRVDLTTYAVELLLDDGNATDGRPYGQITRVAVVDANNGYFIGSAEWGNDTLYHFDPSAPDVAASVVAVADTSGRGLGGLLHVTNTEAGIASDVLFVSRSASSGGASAEIMVLDVSAAPTAVDQRIQTTFNPSGMVLLQLP